MSDGGSGAGAGAAPAAESVAHLALLAGRLLLGNGSDTDEVQHTVARFAAAFGGEASVLVTYEALVVTLALGGDFRTKVGHRVPAMNVGMQTVGAVKGVLAAIEGGRRDVAWALAELSAIEHAAPAYSRWVVVAAMGLTAACLARLFGGNWATMGVVWLAGAAGTALRQELGRRGFNPVLIPFLAALASGVIGGAGVLLGSGATPALCLVAPGMILVPGVPLINGVQDMIRNHMSVGIARLGFAALVTGAIALGLYGAMMLTGVQIPVGGTLTTLPVPEDALFSGLAAIGYVTLFSVPLRIGWACVVCGIASHTLRTLALHFGVDVVTGTLLGALSVGFLAQFFARRFDAPAVAFAFPGVVAMVPGSFAFRAVVGSLELVAAGANAAPALVAETASLLITCALMIGALAIGIAAPLLLLPQRARRA